MDLIPPQLREVAAKVAQGETPRVNVKTLLSWFFVRYRTRSAVREIENALRDLTIETQPHFNFTYLDALVTFIPAPSRSKANAINGAAQVPSPSQPFIAERAAEDSLQFSDSAVASVERYIDPTFRIGRLALANRPITSVAPDAAIREAVTLMLQRDFSQLPVMTTERDVKGIISWQSLGSRMSQGRPCKYVREAMDEHCDVSADTSLFGAIVLIEEHDCILIRDSTRKITGIVTPYDITVTFRELAEPFLVLGEIENHIRNLLRHKFTREQLESARDPGDPRHVNGVEDLTFGEYMRLLQNPENWQKLCLEIDRAMFTAEMDEIRDIRNDVMHFEPEGIEESDLVKLRKFAKLLRRLERLRTP